MALGPLAAAVATTLVATPLLARIARALGFLDRPSAAPERKLQRVAVAPVGGTAILLGLAAARLAGGRPLGTWSVLGPHVEASHELWWWAALGAGFATGLVDDLLPRGLSPAAKLAGQAGAGALLSFALVPWLGDGPGALALSIGLAVVAQNLVNTWDNADGVATASGCLGLAASAPLAAGALAAFLPFNLSARGLFARGLFARGPRADRDHAAPRAYLGDSGSHLVGLLLLMSPWSWPALLPCGLDLARVAWARQRARIPAWRGDRRHLAHRLQEAGLGPRAVVLVLALVTLPGLVPAWLRQASGEPPALGAWQVGGLLAVLAAFSLCVAWTLEPVRSGARSGPL